ncbi:hypothetical protein SLA2020_339640 [Shorea laevis]
MVPIVDKLELLAALLPQMPVDSYITSKVSAVPQAIVIAFQVLETWPPLQFQVICFTYVVICHVANKSNMDSLATNIVS